jgi:hypothetical protein
MSAAGVRKRIQRMKQKGRWTSPRTVDTQLRV